MGFNNKHFVNSDPKEVIQDSYAGILARGRSAGMVYYAQDLQNYYGDSGTELINLSSVDLEDISTYAILDCEKASTRVDKWVVTNLTNATLTENAGNPLNNNRSYSFNNAVGAEGEYCYFEVALPRKVTLAGATLRGADLSFEYGGTINSLEVVLFDGSGNVIGTTTLDKLEGSLLVLGSDNTQVIRFAVRVITGEAASLTFDDVRISNDPVTMIDISNHLTSTTLSTNASGTLSAPLNTFLWDNEVYPDGISAGLLDTSDITFTSEGKYSVTIEWRHASDVWTKVGLREKGTNDVYGESVWTGISYSISKSFIANVTDTSKTYELYYILSDNAGVGAVATVSGNIGQSDWTITAMISQISSIGASKGYAVANAVKSETATYTGFVSRSGVKVKLKTEVVNTSGSVISVDNTDYVKATALQKCSIVAVANAARSTSGTQVKVSVYSSSNVLIYETQQQSPDANTYGNVSLTYELEIGDYAVFNGGDDFLDTILTSFSITATPILLAKAIVAPVAVYYDQTSRWDYHSAYGTVNNKIPYIVNEREVSGCGLYAISSDSVNGFSLTALKDCSIVFTYSQRTAAGNGEIGISLSSELLTTGIGSIPTEERVGYSADNFTGVQGNSVTYSGRLKEGQILRPHTDGATHNSSYTTISVGATALETGFIASPQSDVHKFANDKTPVEKIVGTWNGGNGRVPLYEKSYFLTLMPNAWTTIDSTIDNSTVTPRNGFSGYTNSWSRSYNYYGTTTFNRVEISSNGVNYYNTGLTHFPDSNFTIQYTKPDIVNYLASDVTSVITDVPNLKLTSLVVGSRYLIEIVHRATHAGGGGTAVRAHHNGSQVFEVTTSGGASTLVTNKGEFSFTALVDTMTFEGYADFDDIIHGNGTGTETYVTLTKIV